MSRCQIECHAVSYYPDGRLSAHGEMRTMARCKKHYWSFDPGYPLNEQSMCPIGQIEQAVEDGIKRIERAIANATPF